MKKPFITSVIASVLMASAASAATISGSWNVTAVNVMNADKESSKATYANLSAAYAAAVGGDDDYAYDTFDYTGDLSFGTFDGSDQTTIEMWLDTGVNGSVTGLDDDFGDLQLSKPNIKKGTATTTFFYFFDIGEGKGGPIIDDEFLQLAKTAEPSETDLPACEASEGGSYAASTLRITHDDGVYVCGAGGFAGPNGKRITNVEYGGGFFDMIYVATNGDPSILNVEAVPLPAGMPLLLAGLGGFAFMRRRQTA